MFDLVYPAQETGLAWWPVVVVVATLIVLNVVNNRVAPQTHYLLWSFGGSVLLIAMGLLDGNSWTDMGLGWGYLLPGFVWAAASIGLITAVYLIGSAFRRTRTAFHDERMSDLSGVGSCSRPSWRCLSARCCSRRSPSGPSCCRC